ncbi:MAG TPA: CocE/NonD family hydrolase [Candidatus Thermoplasmatota archaeon]|nr:CocE/NonD family hydrolase [Candidatus Thermoplasmatota archaeon]
MRAPPLAIALLLVGTAIPFVTADGPASTTLDGYFATRDGTLLKWQAVLPGDGSGSYPTLFTYDGYDAGSVVDPGYVARFVPQGYAMVGVSIRGTGCSGGTMDFFEPKQAEDGYDAVEWIASQPWSEGKIAMVGKSYPGITQLFVAAQQPPHLVAVAPGHVYGDIYRDVAYPGGIFNYAFAGLWAFVAQPEPGYEAALTASAAGDSICAQNMLTHTATNARWNAFVQAQEHAFDDDLIKERSPYYLVQNITVPTYLFQSWQDEQVGVRGMDIIQKMQAPYWITLSNGDHGMYRTPQALDRLNAFFNHTVRGEANGWEQTPRVTVWWDAGASGARAPSWTTSYDAFPSDQTPTSLALSEGGVLGGASTGAPDAYLYPAGSTSNGAGYGFGPANPPTDQLRTPAPTRVAYTTAPLADDTVVLGSANLTLWLASTAADTDVEVVLNEVRPDGKVVYVQKGWLRASHRELDGARSSEFKPFHTHTSLQPLTPGEPTRLDIEIFALGHAFRAGSRIQLVVEAPNNIPELWGFTNEPVPAVNLVWHDAEHPSALKLPVLAGVHAPTPLPGCGSLIRQSCV